MSNLALRIKGLRKERKLKLADQFFVKLRTYQGYEYGESCPEAQSCWLSPAFLMLVWII